MQLFSLRNVCTNEINSMIDFFTELGIDCPLQKYTVDTLSDDKVINFFSLMKKYFKNMKLTILSQEDKVNYLKNIFAETYIKDIVNRNAIRNTDVLEDVLNIVSSSVGSLTNPNKLSNSFKTLKNVSLSISYSRSVLSA